MNDSLIYPSHLTFNENEHEIPSLQQIIQVLLTPTVHRNIKQINAIQQYCKPLKFFKSLLTKEKEKHEKGSPSSSLRQTPAKQKELYPDMPDFAYNMPHVGNNPLPFLPKSSAPFFRTCKKLQIKEDLYSKGNIIFKHRDVSNNFYIVLKGRVGVLVKKTDEEIRHEREKIWNLRNLLDKYAINRKDMDNHFGREHIPDDESKTGRGSKESLNRPGFKIQIEDVNLKNKKIDEKLTADNLSDQDDQDSELIDEASATQSGNKSPVLKSFGRQITIQKTLDDKKKSKDATQGVKLKFLEGLIEIMDNHVVYNDVYIMQNYEGLTLNELIGPKISVLSGEQVYTEGNRLYTGEKWSDPAGLLLPGKEVSFSSTIFLTPLRILKCLATKW